MARGWLCSGLNFGQKAKNKQSQSKEANKEEATLKRYLSGHYRQQIIVALVIGALLLNLTPVASQSEAPFEAPVGEQSANQDGETLMLPFVTEGQHASSEEPVGPPHVAASVAGEVVYYHLDITGELVAMTDAAGDVVWRANSMPFGQGMPTSDQYPLRFAGAPQEADTGEYGGLYQLGSRYYDPITGRFISTDPLSISSVPTGNSQAFNRYAYSFNNPYRYSDPTGLQPGETVAGATFQETYAALQEIANDSKYLPDVRKGAQTLMDRMAKAWEVTARNPETVAQVKVAKAIESIAEAKGVIALEGTVSRGAMMATLQNIGEALRFKSIGKLKGLVPKGGGTVLTIAAVLIALPSMAEAAEQDKYGTVGVEIYDLVVPSVYPSQTFYHYDAKTQELVEVPCGTHGYLCGPIENLGNIVDDIISWAKED